MKRKRIITLFASICLALILAILSFMAACAPAAPAGPIILKAVEWSREGAEGGAAFRMYMDMLNEAANGELIIERIGGTETIPGFEQGEALRTGVVDFLFGLPNWFKGLVPEGNLHKLSQLNAWEERESGFHDYMVEVHKKANMFYLGRSHTPVPFNLYSNEGPTTIEGLRGLKFREVPIYAPLYRSLGIIGVTIPFPETYVAMQTGDVDGFTLSRTDVMSMKLPEVVKYRFGSDLW